MAYDLGQKWDDRRVMRCPSCAHESRPGAKFCDACGAQLSHEYRLPLHIPTVVTLHLPIAWYPREIWSRYAGRVQFCCVSESQRKSIPLQLRDVPVIENGVDIPPVFAPENKGGDALVIGRICPEKNAHAALEAATLAHTRVLLIGQVFAYREHQTYFRDKVLPLLAAPRAGVQHQFLGPVHPGRCWELLSRAKCLLHPTLAPETSSLVAMEALAVGTPVIAYRRGALPEIVEHGVTGYLVESAEEMAGAIQHIDALSPAECRRIADKRFGRERMVQRYLQLYDIVLQRSRARKMFA